MTHLIRYPAVALVGIVAGQTGGTLWFISCGLLVIAGMAQAFVDMNRQVDRKGSL